MLALPEETRRRPLVAIKTLADYFSGAQRLPFPVKLGLSVETLTLAGATLQRVSGDVKSDGESWDIEKLDLRAPGITQMRLSGRFGATAQGRRVLGAGQDRFRRSARLRGVADRSRRSAGDRRRLAAPERRRRARQRDDRGRSAQGRGRPHDGQRPLRLFLDQQRPAGAPRRRVDGARDQYRPRPRARQGDPGRHRIRSAARRRALAQDRPGVGRRDRGQAAPTSTCGSTPTGSTSSG